MSEINVLTNLNINSAVQIKNVSEYPDNPQIGQIAFVNKLLVIYSDVNTPDNPSWCPLINLNVPTHTHFQENISLNWNINHNLNSNNLIYFVYDDSNTVIYPSNTNFIDLNNLSLEFLEASKGKVVIFSSDLYTASFDRTISTYYESYKIQSKSQNFIASINTIYSINTTDNEVRVTLPSDPQSGDWVGFMDSHNNFDTNNVILEYDGTNNIHYEPENLALDAVNLNVKFIYHNNNWLLFD